jgi:hypothetical protein
VPSKCAGHHLQTCIIFFNRVGNFRGVFRGKEGLLEDQNLLKTPGNTHVPAFLSVAPELQAHKTFSGHSAKEFTQAALFRTGT